MSFYDRSGNPITQERYGDLVTQDNGGYKIVARSADLPDNVWISTVWLGMDHNFGEGTPLIFETAVFGVESDIVDRYTTEDEALEGHLAILKNVRAMLDPQTFYMEQAQGAIEQSAIEQGEIEDLGER